MLEVLPLSPRTADPNWPKQYSIPSYVICRTWKVGKTVWSCSPQEVAGHEVSYFTVHHLFSVLHQTLTLQNLHHAWVPHFSMYPKKSPWFSLCLWAIPLKFLLTSFSKWLWSPSVTAVFQGGRNSVWWWIVLFLTALVWFYHYCGCYMSHQLY